MVQIRRVRVDEAPRVRDLVRVATEELADPYTEDDIGISNQDLSNPEARLTGEGPIAQGATFAIRFKPFMGQSEGTAPFRSTSRRVVWCFGDRWGRWLPPSS